MTNFYDEIYLAEKLNVDRIKFHREIKPRIVNDFKSELNKLNIVNPDIGLDKNDEIILADPKDHKRTFKTELSIFAYI